MNNEVKYLLQILKIEQKLNDIYSKHHNNLKDIPEISNQIKIAKESQDKAIELIKKTKETTQKFEKTKLDYDKNRAREEELNKIKLKTLSDEQLQKVEDEIGIIIKNYVYIKKNFKKYNNDMTKILEEYDRAKCDAENAGKKYYEIRDAIIEKADPSVTMLKKERIKLIQLLDKRILEVYVELTEHNIFPVITTVKNGICQCCNQKLDKKSLEMLAVKDFSRCTHCGRIVYVDESINDEVEEIEINVGNYDGEDDEDNVIYNSDLLYKCEVFHILKKYENIIEITDSKERAKHLLRVVTILINLIQTTQLKDKEKLLEMARIMNDTTSVSDDYSTEIKSVYKSAFVLVGEISKKTISKICKIIL